MQSGSKLSQTIYLCLKNAIGIFISLIIFVVTVESGAYILWKNGFVLPRERPLYRVGNWDEVRNMSEKGSPADRKIAAILMKWHAQNPSIDTPMKFDESLREEPPVYPVESNKGSRLLTGRYILSSEVDDVFRLRGRNSGKIKYEVRYVTGKDHRRMTGGENRPKAKANLVFLGCSFTFGEGLVQEKTFPALLAKRYPQLRVYNLGVPGMSPATWLEQFMHEAWHNFQNIDTSLPTTFVFTFIDDHMRRVVGTSMYLSFSEYQLWEPYFYLKDGKVQHAESFKDDFLNFRWLLRIYGLSYFAKVSRLEFPAIGDKHLELVSEMYAEMRDRLSKKFPRSKFYVSFFPGNVYYMEKLKEKFQEKKVGYLEHGNFDSYSLLNRHADHGTDSHPSALVNDLYSKLLEAHFEEPGTLAHSQ